MKEEMYKGKYKRLLSKHNKMRELLEEVYEATQGDWNDFAFGRCIPWAIEVERLLNK